MSKFVHLHLHTQYSLLDGALKINELLERAESYGQDAVAITDHGVMHGAVDFYQAASAKGIKPIIGCEAYISSGSRFERKPKTQGGAQTHHLTLLAENSIGYRNLCKLVSYGFLEGFYYKPRIDLELLAENAEGLICLSGCLASEFASYAKVGDERGAREFTERYVKVFGDRFYLEVQPHDIPEQRILNQVARELGDSMGIPLVATNDSHYLDSDDTRAHEVLMCISTGKLLSDSDRMSQEGADLHLKSDEEMFAELPEFEDAVRHTRDVAARCNVELDFNTYHMPQFDVPKEQSIEQVFKQAAAEGLASRLLLRPEVYAGKEEEYQARLELEISTIESMGFPGYFLVVADFIRWAKDNGIPVGPGRGSAAGSLVAWALRITEVDPIEHKLLFERFLNPERVSLPDIDVDFCIHGRDRVIEYVKERYGTDKVAQIVTFGTLKAKAAIKDVGRALGLSYAETDRVAKLVPAPRQGFDYPLKEALRMEKRLREYANNEGRDLIELAQKLEGLSRHTSTHAAGLVIADRPVVELLPLMLDKDEQVVTQYSMSAVEKVGLVKFDFLGLKTLSVIAEATRLIKQDLGEEIDLDSLPLDDKKTFKLLVAGKTIGVFQLESSGITDLVARLRPTNFEDLVAILALYRPGPLDAGMADRYIARKHGREPVTVSHPLLEPILKDTYGIILYQEQIMRLAQEMAGYSLGQADILRRAMGKKKPEEMAKQREVFLSGATGRGVSNQVAEEVFAQMETFARYGFNRSHSVAYALISYQTAYLKAHYPVHFMAALMSFEMDDTDKTLKNLKACSDAGIDVVPPNVNASLSQFAVSDNKVVFGLAAIKGIGRKAADEIINEREANGEFKSLLDFCSRIESGVNRRTAENLIKSGAFDWTEISRAELFTRLERVLKLAQSKRAELSSPQMGLFQESADKEERYDPRRDLIAEWPTNERLKYEKEALGFYLSGHPLEKFEKELARLGAAPLERLREYSDGATVTVAGVVTVLKLRNTRKGDRYASFVLEDRTGTVETIAWPDVYQQVHQILASDDPVLATGRLDISEDRASFIITELQSVLDVRKNSAKEAVVLLNASSCTPERFSQLQRLLKGHQGGCAVKLIVRYPAHSETVIALPPEVRIEPSELLSDEVERLFGEPVMFFR